MTQLHIPALSTLTDRQIRASLAAVDDIRECYRVLEKAGLNIVGEVLKGQGPFYELDHYPQGDVFDSATASQYYYHAHRTDHGEHGHFHLFLRDGAIPMGEAPVLGPVGKDQVVHLVAISMDAWGYPTDLFAVNRWVTDESWLPASRIVPALGRFEMDHAYPSWPVNQWLTAMVRCFRPQIEALLKHRDQRVAAHPGALQETLEDRALEITGSLPIDVELWAAALADEQHRRVATRRA
ncbi:hypothetical protein LPB19_04520 [Marinobacter salinisoli]|uniref:DUF6969 domain-containing protein n=1 Tax=Marinobacter salinisoli TaxID=2769486 RepID=A0ABX7MTI0_9GAMM|nr:hypothetical protein [Marinobacter salinisoli]QSP95682.1 hypothetical protein LPB19_04520 [Marinobacter salinisoli]